jgi:RNA polymerase sigma-70 factor, ECF subfamily
MMDDDIRARLDAGDFREAFEFLLARYQRKVFRLAYSMLGEQAAAEEMAQEVFLQIWKVLPEYRGEASLSTWIYVITRNRCLSFRKRMRTRPECSIEEPSVQAGVESHLASRTRSGPVIDLLSLLAELPPVYRQAVRLFYWEEKSYDEVAAMLGLPAGTVKTYLHRARKQLAQAMLRNAL